MKGLEALEKAKMEHSIIKQGFPEQEYIKTLDDIEKALKTLELIKEMRTNFMSVETVLNAIEESYDYEDYVHQFGYSSVSKEKYDLLKEVLL